MHDSDVITPNLEPSFDVDEEKPLEVLDQENEQKILEKQLQKEITDDKFPVIRAHWEKLAEQYNDVRSLIDTQGTLSPEEFKIQAQVKALMVKEINDLLSDIDQLVEVEFGDESN